jgi:hypothetical protein
MSHIDWGVPGSWFSHATGFAQEAGSFTALRDTGRDERAGRADASLKVLVTDAAELALNPAGNPDAAFGRGTAERDADAADAEAIRAPTSATAVVPATSLVHFVGARTWARAKSFLRAVLPGKLLLMTHSNL